MNGPTQASWRKTRDGARLELTRAFVQPIEKVWDAITDPDRLRRWMGIEWLGDAGPLEAGARFDYRFANTDMETRGHVLVIDPPRVFEHSWFENIPPAAIIRWALEHDGPGCVLTLTHTRGPPEDGPRTAAGWTQLFEALEAELDGHPPGSAGGGMEAWRRRRDEYAAAFPPEALRDGRRVEVDGRPALRFERRLAWPPEAVWAALVDPGALRRWLRAEVVVDPVAGGRFHLLLADGATRVDGVIRRWEPPRVLEYTWPDTSAGEDSLVRYEIFADGEGSRLVLTHALTAGGEPGAFAAAWHWRLDTLESTLAGEARPVDQQRLSALRHAYDVTL
jgi:uncharacterized protein YndB with AHSA1/START domain